MTNTNTDTYPLAVEELQPLMRIDLEGDPHVSQADPMLEFCYVLIGTVLVSDDKITVISHAEGDVYEFPRGHEVPVAH